MIFDTPRPPKRTVSRFIWPIIITLLAVVAVIVSRAGRDTRGELEYLDSIHGQATAISMKGDALRDVISRLSRIDRTELETVLGGIRSDLNAGIELTAAAPPAPGLIAVNALYREALEAWSRGITGYRDGVLAAADDPDDATAIDTVSNALADLRAGDRLYESLADEMARQEVPDALAPMPAVRLMPADGEIYALAGAYVAAARMPENRIARRPGLAVTQIVTDPRWEANPDDEVLVPTTETMTFDVVVSNLGNVESPPGSLVFNLTGDSDPVNLEEAVAALGPGERTTVAFEDVPVVAGGVYEVAAVVAGVPNDIDLNDNEIRVTFTVNEGEG